MGPGRAGIELPTPGSVVEQAPSQTRYRLRYAARCRCLVSLIIRGHHLLGVVLPGGGGGGGGGGVLYILFWWNVLSTA